MYHTEAFILKREEWGEADLLVTALTADFGKIRLLAQGARKHGAKLQGHIEPGSQSYLSFVIGRNGYRLTTAHLQEFFPEIRRSLSKLRAASSALRFIDANVFEERDQAIKLFEILKSALAAIEAARRRGELIRISAWFHVRCFAFLGLLPAAESLEARHANAILAIGSLPLSDIERIRAREETIASELARLANHLESSGTLLGPVERGNFALY